MKFSAGIVAVFVLTGCGGQDEPIPPPTLPTKVVAPEPAAPTVPTVRTLTKTDVEEIARKVALQVVAEQKAADERQDELRRTQVEKQLLTHQLAQDAKQKLDKLTNYLANLDEGTAAKVAAAGHAVQEGKPITHEQALLLLKLPGMESATGKSDSEVAAEFLRGILLQDRK